MIARASAGRGGSLQRVMSKNIGCYLRLLLALFVCGGGSGWWNGEKVCAAVPPRSAASAPSLMDNHAAIHYAKGFTLEYHAGYKILRVLSPWRDAHTTFTYVLVPRGSKHPRVENNAILVETPVRRIVVTSNTFIPYFAMLGLEDRIVGVTDANKVGTPTVAARIRARRIANVGNGAGPMRNLNMECLLALQPDLIMVYDAGNPQYDLRDKLGEAGFHVALNGEYMETSPLGRTEWMKFIAAFFDKDAEAERQFAAIAHRYHLQAAKARTVTWRPTVFCGPGFQRTWHMPGGNGYMATFLRDAGANYLWADDRSTGEIPLNIEAVIARARNADIWLDPGTYRSLAELAGADERYTLFRAFRSGRVYNNNAKLNPGAGNDFWEAGVANPDRVLADLISIFHPELLTKHQCTWFWQLPAKAQAHR